MQLLFDLDCCSMPSLKFLNYTCTMEVSFIQCKFKNSLNTMPNSPCIRQLCIMYQKTLERSLNHGVNCARQKKNWISLSEQTHWDPDKWLTFPPHLRLQEKKKIQLSTGHHLVSTHQTHLRTRAYTCMQMEHLFGKISVFTEGFRRALIGDRWDTHHCHIK